MLELDAGITGDAAAKPRRRSAGRPHKRGQGVASQQAVEGLQGIIALGLQGVSELGAAVSEVSEVALREGEDNLPGEAEILALLPAQWMAKTQFGKQVGKYLISDEHKAVALTLIAYLMRVAPPLYAKAKAANVSRLRNTQPRRSPVSPSPAPGTNNPGQRTNIIPIGPGVVSSPVVGNGAVAISPNGIDTTSSIPVPRIGSN